MEHQIIDVVEMQEVDSISVEDPKPRLSSLIKMSTTKSRSLISKKSLPAALHDRFRSRKPWRRSQPRLEKRLLVKATLDNALRVLSRHQTRLLNGEDVSVATPEASFDDVDVGAWTLVRDGERAYFHETEPEVATTAAVKRGRDEEVANDDNNNNRDNKRFKADWNNNNNDDNQPEESTFKGHRSTGVSNGVEEDDDDVIIDVESSETEPKKDSVTQLNWQWMPTAINNNNGCSVAPFYPPPPPPISPPLPPHLLQPQPTVAFDYDYYFYCLRFFYHYQRFTAAREMTAVPATASFPATTGYNNIIP